MIIILLIMYGPAAGVFILYALATLIPTRPRKVTTFDHRPYDG